MTPLQSQTTHTGLCGMCQPLQQVAGTVAALGRKGVRGLSQIVDYVYRKACTAFRLMYYVADTRFFFRLRPDCYHVFHSSVFSQYVSQLKIFVTEKKPAIDAIEEMRDVQSLSPLEKKVKKLIFLIEQVKADATPDELKTFHKTMLTELRAAVALKHKEKDFESRGMQQARDFVEELCAWMYTSISLQASIDDFVQVIPSIQQAELESQQMQENVAQMLDRINQAIQKDPTFKGNAEPPNRLYDPHMLGDIPSVLYTVFEGATKVIRTPNVTRDVHRTYKGIVTKAALVEEFQAMIDLYERQGKVHLYENLMMRKGSEGIRSHIIEEYDVKSPALAVITLDKDSSFYWQNTSFKHQNNAEEFINTFLSEMFDRGHASNFYWSSKLDKTAWRQECLQIMHKVHEKNFANRSLLETGERCAFIEIVYNEIGVRLIEKFNPASHNKSCKSCVDRGAATLAFDFSRQPAVSATRRKELVNLVFGPALLTMNRPIANCRLPRLQGAVAQIA